MFKVTFTGGEELARLLNALPDEVSGKTQLQALTVGAEPMRNRMAAMAPRSNKSEEHLADHIGISRARTQGDEGAAVAVGPTKSFYWGLFRELGTVYQGAHPFARPAFDETAPLCVSLIGQELWTALRRSIPSPSTFGGNLL